MQPLTTALTGRTDGIVAEQQAGMTILRSVHVKPHRRLFYLNSYGMAQAWRTLGEPNPGQHLWGCIELARLGYEVAMPEEPVRGRFFNYRRQDFKHLRFIREWLGRDGILYSAHTVVFWAPLLAAAGLLRCPVVTLLYAAGENLRFTRGYAGVIAMTPAAERRARSLAPGAKIAHLGWGVDLPLYPVAPYEPRWFLSCGKTRRDFSTLAAASAAVATPVRVINTSAPAGLMWPANVEFVGTMRPGSWEAVSFRELIEHHYAGCTATLVLLENDPTQRYAAGFTQLLEAMALSKPVIVTRTGAIPDEIDVEAQGCGLFVPPNDPKALARAMASIASDPQRAAAMGQAGRRLCERHYDMTRFGDQLHGFFNKL
ncbi:MAG: glycosyltransferase family 4 protein [Opitutaceae bacterium]|nr:glycosyltransferase family 4 protein [Opitutaceae bacterium]